MQRREFIGIVGGASVAWPLSGHAEERLRKLAVIMGFPESDPQGEAFVGIAGRITEPGLGERSQSQDRHSLGWG